MKTALFQMDIAWEDRQANFEKAKSLAGRLRAGNVDLVCLPELFSTAYTMNSEALAEGSDGKTFSFLSNLARESRANVIGSFIEKTTGKPKNCAVVLDRDGKRVAHYSKIHLPGFTNEDRHYQPGDKACVFELEGVKLGVAICYDLRFPELFRELAAKGAKGIFVIANWPAERIMHWDLLLRARAIENQLFVIGVNRVGISPLGSYPGHSVVVGPSGKIASSLEREGEDMLTAEIDFGIVDKVREELPVLKGGRPQEQHSNL